MVILPSLRSNKVEVFVISYKVKKTFKKVLTKEGRRDIIVKLSPRGTPQSVATVIENRTTRDQVQSYRKIEIDVYGISLILT